MTKAVLFDFDGVIVLSEQLHMKTFFEILAPHNVNVSEERWYREFAGIGSRRIFLAMMKEYGIDADVEELVEKRRALFIDYAKNGSLKEMPGLRGFLVYLRKKGIKIAIVSGGHRSYIEVLLGMLGLEGFFDIIVTADDIKARKPDPGPFLYAAEKLGIRPEDCLVVEDSYSGCKAAKRAGMKLVWMRPSESMEPPENDLVMKNFLDERIKSLLLS